MFAALLPLLLLLGSAALLPAGAQQYYLCTERTEGILKGNTTEVLHFKVAPYQRQFKTDLPRRLGVVVRGIRVKACGVSPPHMSISGYSLWVSRGPGPQWPPIALEVTRYLSLVRPAGTPPLTAKEPTP